MTRDEMLADLATWIGEITESDPPVLTEETDLVKDLGLDSLALAELAAKLRRRFQIKLRPGELRTDLRVGRLADFVMERIPQ